MKNDVIAEPKLTVTAVTKTDFTLSDGRVVQHVVEFDETPDLEEFQEIYEQTARQIHQAKNGQVTFNL